MAEWVLKDNLGSNAHCDSHMQKCFEGKTQETDSCRDRVLPYVKGSSTDLIVDSAHTHETRTSSCRRTPTVASYFCHHNNRIIRPFKLGIGSHYHVLTYRRRASTQKRGAAAVVYQWEKERSRLARWPKDRPRENLFTNCS